VAAVGSLKDAIASAVNKTADTISTSAAAT
jgi:hypothetical protein